MVYFLQKTDYNRMNKFKSDLFYRIFLHVMAYFTNTNAYINEYRSGGKIYGEEKNKN